MYLKDNVWIPDGIFELKAYDANNRLIDYVHGQNIVVNDGREALARLLGDHTSHTDPLDPGYTWHVDTMKFGDGGHDPTDATVMMPVNVTDTDLHSVIAGDPPIIAVPVSASGSSVLDGVFWPEPRKVSFRATVEANEGQLIGGTQAYSEAGLFYRGGTKMFAHKSFGYISKNNTIRLVATWTFTF